MNVGMKPTKLDGNESTTYLHHPYTLCHFANLHKYVLFVSCVQRRVVEGNGVGSAIGSKRNFTLK